MLITTFFTLWPTIYNHFLKQIYIYNRCCKSTIYNRNMHKSTTILSRHFQSVCVYLVYISQAMLILHESEQLGRTLKCTIIMLPSRLNQNGVYSCVKYKKKLRKYKRTGMCAGSRRFYAKAVYLTQKISSQQ